MLERWPAAHHMGSNCSALRDLQGRWRLLCRTVKYDQIKPASSCAAGRVSPHSSFCGCPLEVRTPTLFTSCPWQSDLRPTLLLWHRRRVALCRHRSSRSQCYSLWVVRMLLGLLRLCFLSHCYGWAKKNSVPSEAILW